MNSALLDRLLKSGTPTELVAEVASELARADAIQELIERRRAKDRERKKSIPRNSVESTESEEFRDKGLPEVSPLSPFPNQSKICPLNPPKSDEVQDEETDLELKPEHLTEAWNAGPGSRGAVHSKRMGQKRRRRAVTFLRKYPVDDITEAIAAAGESDFLCGRTREGFRADIEFLFDETHMNRLLEGFYGRKSAA